MNKQRRKELSDLLGQLQDIRERLENLRDDEQSAYENMPENLRDSERGEAAQNMIYNLDDAFTEIDNACDTLEEIVCG